MAVDHKILAEMSSVTGKGTTLSMFLNPAGTTTCVRQIWLHASGEGLLNFSGTCMKLFAVPDSATNLGKPTVTTQFFQRTLVTNETYILDCGVPGVIFADQNDSIQCWHLAKTTIGYMIMGTEEK